MQVTLFDYQREAAIDVLQRLDQSRTLHNAFKTRSAFALSAPTGAGKTVIATAVMEAMIFGSADLGRDADPRATFLWVTDSPALNRQTSNRVLAASDQFNPFQLITLGDDFREHRLSQNRVYFLNIQQLTTTANFGRGGSDERRESGWDILTNSIEAADMDLYLVLDEAHRGMNSEPQRKSIVKTVIDGKVGRNPPMPMVWGISATVTRFETAMAETAQRTTHEPVAVDTDKVRESGLIKDKIVLAEPNESGDFSHTLLREAARKADEFSERWAAHSAAEGDPDVAPVLVVQVADGSTSAHLGEIITSIEQEWGGLGPLAFVNVFGEHEDLAAAGRAVRYVAPETIQDESDIRVVFAKAAISTGWDCPRAEVMFSDRSAEDATNIAQIIGRMVRSPLARRITTDDLLNTVACYLPRFNLSVLDDVVAELTEPGGAGRSSEVVVQAGDFGRNPELDDEVFDFVSSLPSLTAPQKLANPLRRAKTLAKLLSDPSGGSALRADANDHLTKTLHDRLNGLAAEHSDLLAAEIVDLETTQIRVTELAAGDASTTDATTTTIEVATLPDDLARQTRRIISSVREGVAQSYLSARLAAAGAGTDPLDDAVHVAALMRVEGVEAALNSRATEWTRENLGAQRAAIQHLTGTRRHAFRRVEEQSSEQEVVATAISDTLSAATMRRTGDTYVDLPKYAGHLFTDSEGQFPAHLNDWEEAVLQSMTSAAEFVAWFRNPVSGSLGHRIGYMKDDGEWATLHVDFIFVSRRDDGTLAASIMDPHGDHLSDAKAKLRGLARFSEAHGDAFLRIESIAMTSDGTLRSLDLLNSAVCLAIDAFEGGQVTALYEDATLSNPFV